MEKYDVVVVGAGVVGCAIARELSKFKGRFLVLEKNTDLCEGTSKANSAIIHAGFDAVPGSKKAEMNVQGNRKMDELSKALSIPFKRIGALVVCLHEEDMPKLEELYERGRTNGVEGLSLLSGEEARRREPNLTDGVCGALLAETSGVVCPFEMTLALGENAAQNGVTFNFEEPVLEMSREADGYGIQTERASYFARAVVNATGVYAGELHAKVSSESLEIVPRRGEYCLLDKTAGGHVSHTIFQLPGKYGKGVLVSPTVHGNLLLGPTAADQESLETVSTTAEGLGEVLEKAAWGVKNLPTRQVITSFAGLRAHSSTDDFILGETQPGFFEAAGVESPGLSAAPAIGEYLAKLLCQKLSLPEKGDFKSTRKGITRLAELSFEERAAKIKENPAYGNIVCRCEEISEGEILEAIHGTLGARTLDGVKRRTRAGMGRCQSGFCSPRVMDILARELKRDLSEIRKSGKNSVLVLGKTRKEGQRG